MTTDRSTETGGGPHREPEPRGQAGSARVSRGRGGVRALRSHALGRRALMAPVSVRRSLGDLSSILVLAVVGLLTAAFVEPSRVVHTFYLPVLLAGVVFGPLLGGLAGLCGALATLDLVGGGKELFVTMPSIGIAAGIAAKVKMVGRWSEVDPETGLGNRRKLQKRIARLLEDGHPFRVHAVGCANLDHLVETVGIQNAPSLLGQLSRRLRSCLPETEACLYHPFRLAILSRGDELPGIEWQSLRRPVPVGAFEVFPDVHGGTVVPEPGLSPLELIQAADMTLSRAMASGLPHLVEPARREAGVEGSLLAEFALALERDELRLHYQPKVDLGTCVCVGAEALLRWTHPALETTSLPVLLAAVEQTSLIDPLTEWVLSRALADAADWERALGRELPVAVNVSTRNLRNPDFSQRARQLIEQRTGTPTLELEITESAMFVDRRAALGEIAKLTEIGFSVAIDDFGTGNSSLEYLWRIPASVVKIDRSFIGALHRSSSSQVIVRAAIQLCTELGFQVVAEGVETEEAAAWLRAHGCTVGQGFLFSRALPSAEFLAYARAH